MLETIKLETFQTGDIFKVSYGDAQHVEIILAKIVSLQRMNPISGRKPFSLIFRGRKEIWINSGTYPMEQERLGAFEMFITPVVPLGNDSSSNYYEAVFS
jgi:hypothetical protein